MNSRTPLWTFHALVSCLAFLLPLRSVAADPAPTLTKEEVKVSGAARLARDKPDSIVLHLEKAAGRAWVEFNYPGRPLDLSTFRDLALRVENQSGAELDIVVTGISNFEATYRYSSQGRFLVRPDEATDLRVVMMRPPLAKNHPFVLTLGNLHAFPGGHQRHWQQVQAEAILRVSARIDWIKARPGQSISISRPLGLGAYSADPALLEKLEMPLVDEFGQTRAGNWPGKLARAEELRDDAARDLALVAARASPRAGRSRFGGDTTRPRLDATGFFRVEKIGGQWWFVDPDGHLFWSVGVNTAGNASETRIKGREPLFPESVRGADDIRFYWKNLARKHGDDSWKARHVDVTLARMFDWGVNTIGAWSMPDLMEARRAPYTLIVHVDTQGLGAIKKIPDPYSAAFKKSLDARLSQQAAAHADSPWLLGVFIDNELDWKNGVELMAEILKSPVPTPARRALVEFLRERHGDIAALNAAWGSSHESWEAIRPSAADPSVAADVPAASLRDLRDFFAKFADTYFAACRDAMRRHFPKHLYLGCRFHTFNPIVTASASRHCDVISVNVYRYLVADLSLATAEDRPYLVSEFHFGVRDYGTWGVGLVGAADARNQADLYQAYVSDALRHPNIVGTHWFQWSNQITTGRFDGENFGVGLVSVVDRPITSLVDAVRRVSDSLYDYRLGSSPSRAGAPAAR